MRLEMLPILDETHAVSELVGRRFALGLPPGLKQARQPKAAPDREQRGPIPVYHVEAVQKRHHVSLTIATDAQPESTWYLVAEKRGGGVIGVVQTPAPGSPQAPEQRLDLTPLGQQIGLALDWLDAQLGGARPDGHEVRLFIASTNDHDQRILSWWCEQNPAESQFVLVPSTDQDLLSVEKPMPGPKPTQLALKVPVQRTRYRFETDEDRHRGGPRLDEAFSILLRRLMIARRDLEWTDLDGSLKARLKQFCAAYPLNIGWYDERMSSMQRRRIALTALFVIVGVAAIALALAVTLLLPQLVALAHRHGIELAGGGVPTTAAIGTELATVLTAGVGVLKTLSSLSDVKARYAIFWRARSALAHTLYTFESRWRYHALNGARVDANFPLALDEALVCAREIETTEKKDFFLTYRDPGEVLDSLVGTALQILPKAASGAMRDTATVLARDVENWKAQLAELEASHAGPEQLRHAKDALQAAQDALGRTANRAATGDS